MAGTTHAVGGVDGVAGGGSGRLGSSGLAETLRIVVSDPMALGGCVVVVLFAAIAVFAPSLAPYDAFEVVRKPGGSLLRSAPPGAGHWLGTSYFGYDILSEVLLGTRVAFIVGFAAAVAVGTISTVLGLVSGYFGGYLDDAISRLVDVVMSIPTLPIAIVAVAILGPSLRNVILVIVALYWRNGVRIIRAAVLTQKERVYVKSARAAGASHIHILAFHILPNILPTAFLWTTMSVAFAILTQATLSFLGLGNPELVSWGLVLNVAFSTGTMRSAWWTVVPPSLCLILLVVSIYSIGRAFEEKTDPRLRRAGR